MGVCVSMCAIALLKAKRLKHLQSIFQFIYWDRSKMG